MMFLQKYAWPLGIVTAMALFMGMTLHFVRKAFSERVDLVATDYYYKDKEFSARLDKARNFQGKGNLGLETIPSGVSVALPPYFADKKIAGKIFFYSPLNPADDFSLPLSASGSKFVVATRLKPGQVWKVSIDFTSAGAGYFAEKSISTVQ